MRQNSTIFYFHFSFIKYWSSRDCFFIIKKGERKRNGGKVLHVTHLKYQTFLSCNNIICFVEHSLIPAWLFHILFFYFQDEKRALKLNIKKVKLSEQVGQPALEVSKYKSKETSSQQLCCKLALKPLKTIFKCSDFSTHFQLLPYASLVLCCHAMKVCHELEGEEMMGERMFGGN